MLIMVRADMMMMLDQLRRDADEFLIHITKHGYQGFRPIQVYTIADNVFSLIFFCPLVVLFCQCTDAILDVLFSQHFPTLGPLFVLLIGIAVEFGCSYYQTFIVQTILVCSTTINSSIPHNELFQLITTRSFNYVLAVANVCHCRGMYHVFVGLEGIGMRAGVIATITGIV